MVWGHLMCSFAFPCQTNVRHYKLHWNHLKVRLIMHRNSCLFQVSFIVLKSTGCSLPQSTLSRLTSVPLFLYTTLYLTWSERRSVGNVNNQRDWTQMIFGLKASKQKILRFFIITNIFCFYLLTQMSWIWTFFLRKKVWIVTKLCQKCHTAE